MARRLPVYLVLDTSGSMTGEPIEAVKNGMQTLLSGLRQDPYALETVALSVITFDSAAKQVVPLTEIAQFQPPDLQASGTTMLGDALRLVAQRAEAEVAKNTPERKGDWKPMVFLMTDGSPSDRDWDKGLAEFQKRKWGIVVCCAAGAQGDTAALKQISENVVQLDAADSASFKAFFKWCTQSIVEGTKSVQEARKDVSGLDQLPPPPPEIQLSA